MKRATAIVLSVLGVAVPAAAQPLVSPYATAWSDVREPIPQRTVICATIDAGTFNYGRLNAQPAIQAAVNACPDNQVVKLSPGRFLIPDAINLSRDNVTLRGSGMGVTLLEKVNASDADPTRNEAEHILLIGSTNFARENINGGTNLTQDGLKGQFSVTVADPTGILAGSFVKLDADEWTTAGWLPDAPFKTGQTMEIWGTDRVAYRIWQPLPAGNTNITAEILDDYSRMGRVIAEIKEVVSVDGNVVTFTSPLHIDYPVSKQSQLVRYVFEPGRNNVHNRGVWVEDLSVAGGTNGNIRVTTTAHGGVNNVECSHYGGPCIDMQHSFRFQIRNSFIHHPFNPVPGGGAYAISWRSGASESLVENNVIVWANKLMAARAGGAGSVVSYNYAQDSLIAYDLTWVEVGINASHFPGPHHVLFEGNQSSNYDSDFTFGSSIKMTVHRNWLEGERRSFPPPWSGGRPARAVGLGQHSWWHAFIGNVLGRPGLDPGKWIYEDKCDGSTTVDGTACAWKWAIWRLGYSGLQGQLSDPKTMATAVREGNFDYLTNEVRWDTTPRPIPASMYLTAKPDFFGDLPWPWVTPEGATKTHVLPARLRYECYVNSPDCIKNGDAAVRAELLQITAERDAARAERDAATTSHTSFREQIRQAIAALLGSIP